jgi:hypothetical protein
MAAKRLRLIEEGDFHFVEEFYPNFTLQDLALFETSRDPKMRRIATDN